MKSAATHIISLSDYAGTPLSKAYEASELEKAGEGSRGGHIVGHTKSGKAIYHSIGESKEHDKHYTFEDHEDAASEHRKTQKKYETAPGLSTANADDQAKARDRIVHHKSNADYHEIQADKKGKKHVTGAKGNVFEHHKRKIAVANSKMPDAIRGMFEKAEDDAYALLGLGEELSKAGEGSKGGKIIGHTRSGKPVYDHADHPSHDSFVGKDHADAANLHQQYGVHSKDAERGKHHEAQYKEHHKKTFSQYDNESLKHAESEHGKGATYHEKLAEHREHFGKMGDREKAKYRSQVRTTHDVGSGMKGEKTDEAKQRFAAHKQFLEETKSGKLKKSESVDELTKAYDLLGLEELVKSGEGSRGGHIIGHTHTGKPIYNSFEHEGHKDFNSNDHQGAAKFHLNAAHQKYFEGKHAEQSKHLDESRKHQLEGFSRHVDSFNEVYNNPKVRVLTISSKNPLSTQLSKLTGDSWNTSDFSGRGGDGLTAGLGTIFTHNKTGQHFTAINEREAEILKKYKR